jgi:hypothetical protein
VRGDAGPRPRAIRLYATHCSTTIFTFAPALFPAIIVAMRSNPRANEGAMVARPRATTAQKIRLVLDTTGCQPAPASSGPDPRLVRLVRILARQAARDFVQEEIDRWKRDRSPK